MRLDYRVNLGGFDSADRVIERFTVDDLFIRSFPTLHAATHWCERNPPDKPNAFRKQAEAVCGQQWSDTIVCWEYRITEVSDGVPTAQWWVDPDDGTLSS